MRFMPVLVGVVLGACSQDYNVTERNSRLEVSPALTDIGTVAVGSYADFDIQLMSIEGDIEIRAIDIENIDGDVFTWESGEVSVLADGGAAVLGLRYSPTEAGYHRATLRVTAVTRETTYEVQVRARAVVPTAQVWPLVVDYGVAESGVFTEQVRVVNSSDLALTLEGAEFTSPGFELGVTPPVTIAPGSDLTLPVNYSASGSETVTTEMSLNIPGVTLPSVRLMANNCESGIPSAYDVDGDGWTSCAGDCDDSTADTHPGAPEQPDWIDQDCDDVVDEGTINYDDDGDGYAEIDGDCNDGDVDVSPATVEIYGNGIDDDCDGDVDQGAIDTDLDGYTELGGDCDDSDGSTYPGAPESADGTDNDCDGTIDEGTTAYDDDGDGYTEDGGDCDDTDSGVAPGLAESPDWIDNDCDGSVDEGTINADDDGDGYSELGGDCDDTDGSVSPAEPEVLGDSIDNDCDGTIE